MKTAYFDLIGGASGDMILGALLDAGLPPETLLEGLDALKLEGYRLNWRKVSKNGFQATKVDIEITDPHTERHLADILAVVTKCELPERIKKQAAAIFQRLGEVEAGIHGVTIEQVHLHELGGLDTILDVCGTLVGLQALGVEQIHCSAFPLGGGFIKGAHGKIPLPAPATVALLQGAPVVGSEIDKELVTPTGAALLTSLASRYGPIPAMRLQAVGYGAGGRDLPVPNLLRVLIGETAASVSAQVETLVALESNIDDLNPQVYDYLLERLFQAGALDVTLTPMHMKKNRPAVQLSVLCPPQFANELEAIVFAETSTIGIRRQTIERHALPRRFSSVETRFGAVRLKIVEYAPGKSRAAPEYEDLRRLAQESEAPLWEIYRAVLAAYSGSDADSLG
jgi:pyridinium-3,5-bisthiocarboxylic acid mononucleotide nickel chelatase